jgi:inhibitor of KinA
MVTMPIQYQPAGDQSILVQFGNEINEHNNAMVRSFAHLVESQSGEAWGEVILGYTTVLVHYNPLAISFHEAVEQFGKWESELAEVALPASRVVEIPVVYGGQFGPDLEDVAVHNGLSSDEVMQIHASKEYLVYFLGFTPGFPFLGGMSEKIATPRLQSPRVSIPAGSVGIANNQTGIYPVSSPGGWRLVGRTPLRFYDPVGDPPFLLQAGDYLRFVKIDSDQYHNIKQQVDKNMYVPVIRVARGS